MGAVRGANGSQRFVHILLVEDDAQLGAAIQRALERLSYTVSWLRDGRSALNAIRDRSADLILLDLGLPEIGRAHV